MTTEFTALCETTPDPAQARRGVERLESVFGKARLAELLPEFEDALPALFHLLAISPVSVEKIVRDSSALGWLAKRQVRDAGRSRARMRTALARCGWVNPGLAGTVFGPDAFQILRRWKQRESLRIALRDAARLVSLEETTLEITQLAEICMREISCACLADQTRQMGEPGTAFAVIGMGKFGGQELSFSPDIEAIFFYGEPGNLASGLTRQEFFSEVAQKIIETFAAPDPAGALFRVDLQLRPGGEAGAFARSLEEMVKHYAEFGETRERLALSKARPVAGDEALGYEFCHRMQAFTYPRAIGGEVIEEVAQLKESIERELQGPSRVHRDVKWGRGGIREVEFICQALQLIHGARHAFLQERRTLRSIEALRQLGFLAARDAEALAAAYRFLRNVEHRLQIENEAHTHTIPENGPALIRLARSLRGWEQEEPAAFLVHLIRHMDAVRAIFERVMQGGGQSEEISQDLAFFRDPELARKHLAEIGGGGRVHTSQRAKQLFARLEPQLVDTLKQVADPDAALARLCRFAGRHAARGAFFETLLVNPRVLELFAKLFDASPFLSEIAIQRPQLVEEVARLGNLGASLRCADHRAGLARNDGGLPWQQWLRVYQGAQQLRIGLRDLLGFASLPQIWMECSELAGACLKFTIEKLGASEQLTTIAFGELGGRELGYGADLEVLFIGDDACAAQQVAREMSACTADGRVFAVDARLWPGGEQRPMALTLDSWRDYFASGRGELWEAQRLTKARPICGPEQGSWLVAAQAIWKQHGQRPDLREHFKALLQKVAEQRGGDPMLDFKTGPGGLMQLEFYARARQMRAAVWEPNTLQALPLVAPAESTPLLTDAYLFLRKVESVLRRFHDAPVSRLPDDALERNRLARRCDQPTESALRESTQRAREIIARHARL